MADKMGLLEHRDVALNIRLSTPETRGLGIDTHFCEVQLILTEFAATKVRQIRQPGCSLLLFVGAVAPFLRGAAWW